MLEIRKFSRYRHRVNEERSVIMGKKKIITFKENRNQIKPPAAMINEGWLYRISWCLKKQRIAMQEQHYKLM